MIFKIISSLAYFIVRMQYIIHITYKVAVLILFLVRSAVVC